MVTYFTLFLSKYSFKIFAGITPPLLYLFSVSPAVAGQAGLPE